MGLGVCEGALSHERSRAPRARRNNSDFDFALKGHGFSRAAAPQNQCRLYRLRKNSGFVSGYRFSDTASSSESDAPLGAGH
jgi:hypothetical protein